MIIEYVEGDESCIKWSHGDEWKFADLVDLIDAYEAEPIVPCKECKWYGWGLTECHNPRYGDGWANYPSPQVYDEYFCKDGERKDEV